MEVKRNDKKNLKRRGEMGDIYRHRKYIFFAKHPPTAIFNSRWWRGGMLGMIFAKKKKKITKPPKNNCNRRRWRGGSCPCLHILSMCQQPKNARSRHNPALCYTRVGPDPPWDKSCPDTCVACRIWQAAQFTCQDY